MKSQIGFLMAVQNMRACQIIYSRSVSVPNYEKMLKAQHEVDTMISVAINDCRAVLEQDRAAIQGIINSIY